MTMRYRIYFTLSDGSEDSVVVEGESVEELQEVAAYQVALRGGSDPWSEEL